MFLYNIDNCITKRYRFSLNISRRFSENSENLLKLFNNIKDAECTNNLHQISSKFYLSNDTGTFKIGYYDKNQNFPELDKIEQCVNINQQSSLQDLLINPPDSCYLVYKNNKEVIFKSFTSILNARNKNYKLSLFISDSLLVVLNELNFDEIYDLIRKITKIKLGDSLLDSKISSIFEGLLKRVNVLITEKLSLTRGIVRVNSLPKYSRLFEETSSNLKSDSDLVFNSFEDFEKLWHLWYLLSKHSINESKHTISLLLSILESETKRIFQFDLRRLTRSLDVVIGDSESFSKLEERFISRLLKRFVVILPNLKSENNSDSYLKCNNITPIHVKKFFCNISKLCKIAPRVMKDFLTLNNSYLSLQNFVKLSRLTLENEFIKTEVSNTKVIFAHPELSEYLNTSLSDVNSRYKKLIFKIFLDSVEILKFLDRLSPPETSSNNANGSECFKTRSDLIGLSHDLLLKSSPETEEQILSQLRSIYYLFLSFSLNNVSVTNDLSDPELFETVCNKVIASLNTLISGDESLPNDHISLMDNNCKETSKLTIKSIQCLHYCDKIVSLFYLLGKYSEMSSKLNMICTDFVKSISKNHAKLLTFDENQGLKTLYLTILNKYGLLSPEIYSTFLNNLNDWSEWKKNEIAMLCDLFSRTYPANALHQNEIIDSEIENYSRSLGILNALNSLIEHIFFQGNSFRLGNKEFVSLLTCLDIYINDFKRLILDYGSECQKGFQEIQEAIRFELSSRINSMNFNQLVKLLKLNQHLFINEDLRSQIVERIKNLDYLGDISCLVDLNDSCLTSFLLKKFEVKIVDEEHAKIEGLLKDKGLNHFKKSNNENYTTLSNYHLLKCSI